MNCKFCGNEMEENQTVCPACDKEQAAPEMTPEPKVESKASNRKWWIIGGVAVAVLAIVIAIGFLAFQTVSNELGDVSASVTQEVESTTEPATSAAVNAFTTDLNLEMVDEDGVFIPHDFVVADELITQEMAETVVATCGELSMDNALLAYYYYQSYMDMYSEYGSYISMILDPSQSLATQMLSETQSFQDMLVQGAVSAYQQEAAIYNAAMAEGFEMSEDYANYCADLPNLIASDVQAQGYATAEEYLVDFYGPYATMDSFLDYVTVSMTANEFMSTKTVDISNTEEEILAYYDENIDYFDYYGMSKDAYTVDVRHILVTLEADENATTDEYGQVVYSEESWAAATAEAEALLAEWQAGEATEDSFAALATEKSQDPGSATNGGLYEGVYVGQMVENFDAWCFDESRQYGDSGIVESTYGYHIMFFVGKEADNAWYEAAASELLYNKQSAVQQELVTQWEFQVNYNNVVLPNSQLEVELAAMYAS